MLIFNLKIQKKGLKISLCYTARVFIPLTFALLIGNIAFMIELGDEKPLIMPQMSMGNRSVNRKHIEKMKLHICFWVGRQHMLRRKHCL